MRKDFFPRKHPWHRSNIDSGKKLNNRSCPNCGSKKFIETVSIEYCPDCKLECDYWEKGPNKVYNNMMDREARIEEDKRWRQEQSSEAFDEDFSDYEQEW